jgi:hydrogenase/urease accessory protein HupE
VVHVEGVGVTPQALVRIATAFATIALPQVAHAHLVNTGLGPFYDGVIHFLATPEDLLPAVALALLAGLRGAAAGRASLFAITGAWFLGGGVGLAIPVAGSPLFVTTLSLLVLGGLVALDARLPVRWIGALAALVGFVHGGFNGAAMATAKLGLVGLVGIVVAVFVVVTLATALVVALRAPSARIAVRVAGSWLVATGLLLAGWSLRA